ncbi:hypothetical protein K7X08_001629 [Anisodus acutangulus]|uniref:AT-hook motif nuclear-localized protein n=1 Tax=Anisodus acutangulus TaxID=402998 RepID=A0A9Q1R4P4_9SOLA|nr:hypothetical protein K7X08_001629 [Anisodus acutangulus]
MSSPMNTDKFSVIDASAFPPSPSPSEIDKMVDSFISYDESRYRGPHYCSPTRPSAEDSTVAGAGLSPTSKRERPSEHGLGESTPAPTPSIAGNKRPRPSEHGLDESTPAPPLSAAAAATPPSGPVFSEAAQRGADTTPAAKKPRGRPIGSKNKQKPQPKAKPTPTPETFDVARKIVSESAGSTSTIHTLSVEAGEDIAEKIASFIIHDTAPVKILFATGEVSTMTVKKPGRSGEITKHEGLYRIMTLSGSFTWPEIDGQHCWSGALDLLTLSSDGLVVGGSAAGELIAASPTRVCILK